MDEAAIRGMLDGCLLTDEDMALGPEGWLEHIEDPLPSWVEGEEDGDLEEGEEVETV
jgi:hypothetical protein